MAVFASVTEEGVTYTVHTIDLKGFKDSYRSVVRGVYMLETGDTVITQADGDVHVLHRKDYRRIHYEVQG